MMATHGHMLLKEGENEITLYTWHDGSTKEAIQLLLELPWILQKYGRLASEKWHLEKEKYHGPWYYDHLMRFAIESLVERKRKWTKNDLIRSWRDGSLLYLCLTTLANWISFVDFDKWTTITDKSWIDSDVDIIVEIQEFRNPKLRGGYTFNVQNYDDVYIETIDQKIAELNDLISDDKAKITILNQKRVLSEDKMNVLLPTIFVPIEKIILDLMWTDINKAYDVLDGKSQDDYVSAIVSHVALLYERRKVTL